MRYRGKYRVSNPRKYKGDARNVVYRSSWEYKFMEWCDSHPSVEEWASEEIIIPYISPVDGKRHSGKKKYIAEVKPSYQTKEPKTQKRNTKKYISEVMTYAVNQAKFKAATEFCKDHGWEFMVVTEKELKI